MDAPVKLAALSAENHLRKAMIAGVGAFLACRTLVNDAPADKFLLYLHEDIFRNDGRMIVLNIVLRHDASVLDSFLCKEVGGIGFLQKGIAHVFFVPENLVDRARVPFFFSGTGKDVIRLKSGGYFVHAEAFEIFAIDALHNFGLLSVNYELSVIVFRVTEEAVVINTYLSLLVTILCNCRQMCNASGA